MNNLVKVIFLFLLNSCTNTNSFTTFNNLKDMNFINYKNTSITYRRGTYIVSKDTLEPIFIEKASVSNKIKRIWYANQKEIHKTAEEINSLEELLISFDKLNVMHLSVDNKENVMFTYIADEKCTYYFLKLSPKNTINEINKSYYKKYSDNWYINIECSQ
jgi:hypothetical protein